MDDDVKELIDALQELIGTTRRAGFGNLHRGMPSGEELQEQMHSAVMAGLGHNPAQRFESALAKYVDKRVSMARSSQGADASGGCERDQG